MSPRAGTEKAEGRGVIGERSYLEILNKSSDLKKESLTSLKQIQLQLRGDSERVDRVSGVTIESIRVNAQQVCRHLDYLNG